MLRYLPYALPVLFLGALLLPAPVHMSATDPAPAGDQQPTPTPPQAGRSHPLAETEIAQAVATIDGLVLAGLRAHGQQPNPPTDDATFLRRAYLQILGRIPTAEEATAFLTSITGDRRNQLITDLMANPGRVHHEFTWWADLLRISTRLGDRYSGNAYVDWMKEAIRANKPYDQIVRELITAEGPAMARGNGATGYYLRDAGMPLDNMANTIQVFLGTRVQCAMCHDHPFDKWKRKEFYELAAYTNSVSISREVKGLGEYRRQAKEAGGTPNMLAALRMLGNTVALGVHGGDRALIELPADYQYSDAKPKDKVAAKPLFGELPPMVEGKTVEQQRAKVTYAAWLTAPENPRFSQVIANRLWKRAFGLGLIEPVDNLTDSTVASDPELLAYLTKLMISVDYDLPRFSAILYRTEAWQRASTTNEVLAGEPYYFPGPVLRRLSAEQLWDSLLTLAVPDLDQRQGESAERLYQFYEDNHGKSAKELFALAQEIAGRRDQMQAIDGEVKEVRQQLTTIQPKDSPAALPLKAKLRRLQDERESLAQLADTYRMVAIKKKPDGLDLFVRADELPSPAPAGHFLRVFGQSDRDIIEAASTAPATTQALTMLNGFIDRELLKERSVLYQEMLSPRDVGGKVDMLFLALLSRAPTVRERDLGKSEIAHALLSLSQERKKVATDVSQEAAKAALHTLAWVLLNSNEFLFIQ